ncbi:UbiE/COQ5 methyltransferase [Trichormus variabilis ATCC 29413]|uniref:UbiE/COQ5 methyltransferase n=2 Tax=Anabaena variabilis TaxID=264691 RepID=Q3MCT8_TRIV2|nr:MULTISPECIES: class I SAM-dependent methyltransferase [Nostocaceae]ABA21198.1 UbiE/COQ5 methyltransferase [Trichormus variabilis ATCC 29413]MBC1214129.1 class I SAM-dependent methyltransferase [Trichormus variabilis ARAD]MBC1256635.1 class I SAM-dependent methyltransferase [Trichormus variabilis V5]MBC1267814.1 class I SAM-dependent methyltransferase [Trichormus variabilis FSR]MBC1303884.1 class I SAM-dependent methyltransferase [Trichormus variabilis N2B]
MATIFRDLSYRYQWLYDSISRVAALTVGGEARFRQLALQGLTIEKNTSVLDVCCGSGQATQLLVKYSQNVTGLDASPLSLRRARQNVPEANYVEAFAEKMPFPDKQFDVVHTSAALHEMEPQQLREIIQEVYRVLKPGGIFTLVDFHTPTNPIFWPGLTVFLLLFETETAWQLLKTDLAGLLTEIGFEVSKSTLYAGGSLQVIQAKK